MENDELVMLFHHGYYLTTGVYCMRFPHLSICPVANTNTSRPQMYCDRKAIVQRPDIYQYQSIN